MARLIFCFFAEDTGIFRENQFTATITQMCHAGHGSGAAQWGNLRKRLATIRVFSTRPADRATSSSSPTRKCAPSRR